MVINDLNGKSLLKYFLGKVDWARRTGMNNKHNSSLANFY
jgi:hypothetical protein